MTSQEIERLIIEFFTKRPLATFKRKELAQQLQIHKRDFPALREALRNLVSDGKISRGAKRRYGLPRIETLHEGVITFTRKGIGFVSLDDTREDIYIQQGDSGTALEGDRVKIEIFAKRSGKSREGKVREVVKRKRDIFIGTYWERGSFSVVVPDDERFNRDIYIPAKGKHAVRPGERVIVQLTTWDDPYANPEGRITEVLGDPAKAEVATRGVMLSFGLNDGFPKEVETESKRVPKRIPRKEYSRRLDIRNLLTVTIDPSDAKDFDDAVSLETIKNGNYRLGVHIADVSAFVQEGSAIDKEALRRGTSVYLPNRVVPMLPSVLSEEMCSLKPNVDRLSFSVFMDLTPEGTVTHTELRETVIKSDARLTYEEAQEMLDGHSRTKIAVMVRELSHIARTLKRKRLTQGSLDFDLPEITFAFDPLGVLEDIRPKVRLESHKLVEECMLLANKCVTRLCHSWRKEKNAQLPFIYRIHEQPEPEKVAEYARLLKALGIPFKAAKKTTPKAFKSVIERVRDTKEERLIGELTLRTMQKARYDLRNKGHFGLAFREYTHFTSPIRRYPDLAVHRLLKLYKDSPAPEVFKSAAGKLNHICTHSSERERNALEAEREAVKIQQLEYMKWHVGEDFKGIISGVVSFGLFVELDGILAEGLIHIRDMDDDYYEYDEKRYALVGRRHHREYRLGDPVTVRVINVSEQQKHLNLMFAGRTG